MYEIKSYNLIWNQERYTEFNYIEIITKDFENMQGMLLLVIGFLDQMSVIFVTDNSLFQYKMLIELRIKYRLWIYIFEILFYSQIYQIFNIKSF